jgi:glycosyltransferase involved in cell wall biosynthesis
MNALQGPSIAVVIPAYRVAGHVEHVVARVPAVVRHIIVVDDASPDLLQDVLAKVVEPRLIVLRHEVNRGVGGAMKTGIQRALELGADIVVKVDGDGQMDPALIPQFVEPIVSGEADFAKGNRFDDLSVIRAMPFVRRAGNLALSFLVKLASGYWHAFDPTNTVRRSASQHPRTSESRPAGRSIFLRDQPALRGVFRQSRAAGHPDEARLCR